MMADNGRLFIPKKIKYLIELGALFVINHSGGKDSQVMTMKLFQAAIPKHQLVIVHSHLPEVVITGGESGPGARPCHPDWIRSLRDQCETANTFLPDGIPFFFKQWGEWKPIRGERFDWRRPFKNMLPDGSLISPRTYMLTEKPKGIEPMWRVGKHKSGHLLDGVEHREFPKLVTRNTQPETI